MTETKPETAQANGAEAPQPAQQPAENLLEADDLFEVRGLDHYGIVGTSAAYPSASTLSAGFRKPSTAFNPPRRLPHPYTLPDTPPRVHRFVT